MFIAFAFHKEQAFGVEPPARPAFVPRARSSAALCSASHYEAGQQLTALSTYADFSPDIEDDIRVIVECTLPRYTVQILRSTVKDRFEWDLRSSLTPEAFASQLCADVGLSGEAVGILSHAIREQLLVHRRAAPELMRADELKSPGARPLEDVWRDLEQAGEFGPLLEPLAEDESEKTETDAMRNSRNNISTLARESDPQTDSLYHRTIKNPSQIKMQLRLSFVLAAVVLTTGISASSAPQGEGMQIKADLVVLHGLETKENPTKAEANKAFAELNIHLATFGKQYDALAKKYAKSKKDSRDLVERQALLQPAIKDLTAQFKKLLTQVRILTHNLTIRLGLTTVSVIIKQITPGLRSIDSGLYQILDVPSDDLGPGLVDPLRRTVYGLLDGLGLNLNARKLEISEEAFEARAEPTKAFIKAEAAVSFKHASSIFKNSRATFNSHPPHSTDHALSALDNFSSSSITKQSPHPPNTIPDLPLRPALILVSYYE
ncbi:hypothetical protein V8E36_002722 [Tilletia maclaganii]